MADRNDSVPDGLGEWAQFQYDLGAYQPKMTCDLPTGIPCYPHITYDAEVNRLAVPPQPDADAPVVVKKTEQ
jgi:hypothetical protein